MLSLDEVPSRRALIPASASDYADSLLMFNVYDTVVLPNQVLSRATARITRRELGGRGNDLVVTLRQDVASPGGNLDDCQRPLVFSIERMKALGQGLSFPVADMSRAPRDRRARPLPTSRRTHSPFIASLVPPADPRQAAASWTISARVKAILGAGARPSFGQNN